MLPSVSFSLFVAALLSWTAADAACLSPIEQVCFTPGENCTELIVSTVSRAKSEVLVQAYSFTSAPIAKALVDAKKRGVSVLAILDKSQRSERYSELDFLVHAGIPTWIDTQVAIAHNKVMVIDGEKVITGSFNFTKSAQEKNAENVLLICGSTIAEKFRGNWEARRTLSEIYRTPRNPKQ